MTNQSGFLLDEDGVIRGLEIPISPCPVSGLPRRAYHESLTKERDLQMVHRVGVTTYSEDTTKTVREEIMTIVTDSRRRQIELDKWVDRSLPFSTAGSVVNPQTGAVLPDDSVNGLEQLAFMQSLTVAKLKALGMPITSSTPVLQMEYMMLLQQIQSYDQAGRL